MKTIEIIIDPVGRTRVEADGFTGTECTEATSQVIAALSSGEVDRDPKDEMYSEPGAENEISQGW